MNIYRSSTTTTTVWLDADPASTDGSTGSCPTGHFTLPLNQSAEVDTCIMDPLYTNTWGCLDVAKLGINVFEAPNGGPPVSVVFDDYSIRPQLFKYGPQPADFNGSAFTLAPYKDKEDDELGVALFFSVLFDKLSICKCVGRLSTTSLTLVPVPADALSPPDEKKRSVPAQHLAERQTWDDSNWLKVGDQPWYCFWNSTISEFWIFLNQDIDDSGASATTSSDTSTITTPSNPYFTKSYSTSSATVSLTESSTVMDPSKSTPSPSIPTKSYANGKVKRQATQIGSSGFFPKLVKMVEKRKPHSNVQPYCQQMQVLNNWQILPIETVPTICIDESEYNPAAATSTGYGKTKRSPEEIQQMGSNCICEWFSDY